MNTAPLFHRGYIQTLLRRGRDVTFRRTNERIRSNHPSTSFRHPGQRNNVTVTIDGYTL